MTRIQRRIFTRGAVVGMLLTITVIAADLAGALAVPEDWLYDLRARHFQFFMPQPSDRLVHVDIDDRALEQIGSWPWPREKLADMLDEMRLAGVKAVALDVLFTEAQDPVLVAQEDDPTKVLRVIDNDAAFASSVERLGNVVIPASLSFDRSNASPAWRAIVDALRENPELDEAALVTQLGLDRQRAVTEYFLTARRVAMFERISREMAPSLSREELRRRILKTQQADVNSPVSRAFDEQYARWESAAAIKRLAAPAGPLTPSALHASTKLLPLPGLARRSAASAFVDFTTDRDGVFRSVPLLVELDGQLIPQMGLSLAMRSLGVQAKDLKVNDRSIVIPVSGGSEITIPVEPAYVHSQGREVGLMFSLPWFGGRRWEEMYDVPARAAPKQRIAITQVWAPCDLRRKIAENNRNVEMAIRELREILQVVPAATNPSDAVTDNPNLYADRIATTLSDASLVIGQIEPIAARDRDEDDRIIMKRVNILRDVRAQNTQLAKDLAAQRASLAASLAGKSALIGWTATGMLDMTPTSLHARCPGVMSHGVIFSSIMTGNFWRRGPLWITVLATLLLGLIAAAMASWLSPLLALGGTFLLGGGYLLFNGLLLFDRNNLIVGLAGPLGVLAIVWAGCTLNRIIVEASERARITRRFRSYVDPTLVTHVLENPDLVRLEGETRELTVVFTDLAGFTTISERLGEQTVPLLNDYMGRMVPIIRAQKGYVNKFLGDGIMFFFGAPISNSTHAAQAVESVLEMQPAVEKFNQELAAKGLPAIGMRAGISSGMMVVGDAGSAEASDYTVLGDTVNLGARLESANKAVGTKILMNARTAELLDGRFLLRPIGKLQVVGKAEGVMTFEALCLLSAATEDQKRLAKRTTEMVEAFMAGRFNDCLQAADSMDAEFGAGELASLYREECQAYFKDPPDVSFDGRIKLTEK